MTIRYKNTNFDPAGPRHVAYYDLQPPFNGAIGATSQVQFSDHAYGQALAMAQAGDMMVMHQLIHRRRRVVTHVAVAASPVLGFNAAIPRFPHEMTVLVVARLQSAVFAGVFPQGALQMDSQAVPVAAPQLCDVAWRPAGGVVLPTFYVQSGAPWRIRGGVAVNTAALVQHVVHSGLYDLMPNAAALITVASEQGLNQ